MRKENWPALVALTSAFSVELPGIEPVSGCWSLSRTGTELRNDIAHDSPELTSVDLECAQNVPSSACDDSESHRENYGAVERVPLVRDQACVVLGSFLRAEVPS